MNSRNIRSFSIVVLILLAVAPIGCRSRKTVEPVIAAPQPKPIETVQAPAPKPKPAPAQEDTIDWSNLDEVNRMAAARGWLKDAFFEYDSAGLTDAARAALSDSASWLKQNPRFGLVVEGHCDERGTEQYNLALGERRAHAATEYLIGLGVPRERLSMVSYGKERPFVRGSSEQSHAENRRAHLKINRVNG